MNLLNLRREPRMAEPTREPHDEALEAAYVSARALMDMKARLSQLEAERDHFRAQSEIWKARAEAEARLCDEMKKERDFYQRFNNRIVNTATIVNDALVKMMGEAKSAAYLPDEPQARPKEVPAGPGDDGSPVPTFLTDRHLEAPDDKASS